MTELPIPAAGLPPDWTDKVFLALDFETTGLDSRLERVVEIGAIRFSPASPGRESAFASLVDPEKAMPRAAQDIHGLSDGDLAGAPRFASLAPALLELGRGSIYVAHNAGFDFAFLRVELERSGQSALLGSPPVLDTRLLAKAAFPGRRSYRLVDLAADFGLDPGSSHRALDDARTCMELFLLCARRLASRAGAA
ncbi:MAG TPA: 3'-5' exonuclease [Rectinemataceae bacterium]|nr:3'-5' exonuclease [Rectinemataceae bacterium]